MKPATKRTVLTFAALFCTALSQTPGLSGLVTQGAACMAGFLMAWAHTSKPGDVAPGA